MPVSISFTFSLSSLSPSHSLTDCVPAGVGKTSLLLRYANDSFSSTFIATIGIDFKIKNIQLDGKRIKLQVGVVSCRVVPYPSWWKGLRP